MENKISKLSKLKPPTTDFRKLITKSTTNLTTIRSGLSGDKMNPPTKPAPKRIPLSRRSKSMTDLRPPTRLINKPLKPIENVKKPIAKPFLSTRKPVAMATTTSSQAKRQAIDKTVDASTKPKVAKVTAKPAPYDYKARFGLLSEKYKTLLESTNEMKDTHSQMLTDIETYKYDNEQLKEELKKCEIFAKEHVGCKDMISTLQNEKNTALNLNEKLIKSEEHLKSELQIKQTANDTLSSELDQANRNIQALKDALEDANGKIDKLHSEVKESEDLRRVLHNTIQDLKGNIRVFCRVRPAKSDEDDKMLCNIDYLDENSMEIRKSRDSIKSNTGKPAELFMEFSFDKVFQPESSQDEVFEDLAQLVQSALDGYNVCVFAYGQTGSGKTFTMQGTESKLGMIPRTIDLLFKKIERLEVLGWKYEVQSSFFEIYNETINDLLEPGNKKHEILFNLGRGVTVTNLRVEPISSAKQFKKHMQTAHNNRAVACTNYNEHSSRSHAVTKITMLGTHKESDTEYYGTLVLVDLAGSESPKHTAAERITETKNINKSLSTLGTVMLSLHNKDKHVPYRNSKLTYLLQSCLGGNSKTLMFVNIAPFEECYGETVNSLRFAAKVKEVKTGTARNARKNMQRT